MGYLCNFCNIEYDYKLQYSLHLRSKLHKTTKNQIREELTTLSKEEILNMYGVDGAYGKRLCGTRLTYMLDILKLKMDCKN